MPRAGMNSVLLEFSYGGSPTPPKSGRMKKSMLSFEQHD